MTSGAVIAVSLISTVGVLGICIGWFYVRKFNRKRVRLKEKNEKEEKEKMDLRMSEVARVSSTEGPVEGAEENEKAAAFGADVTCADLGAGILSVGSGDGEKTERVDFLDRESEDGSNYSESASDNNDIGGRYSDHTRASSVCEGECKCSTDSVEIKSNLHSTSNDVHAHTPSNNGDDGSDCSDASMNGPVVMSTYMYDIPAELDVIFTPSQRYTINMSIKKGVHLNGTVEAQIDGSQGDNPIEMSDHSDVHDSFSPAEPVDEWCDADVDESGEMYVEYMQENSPPIYPDFSQEEHSEQNDNNLYDQYGDGNNDYADNDYTVNNEYDVDDVNSVHSVYSNRSEYDEYNYDNDQHGDHSVYQELYEDSGQDSDRTVYSETDQDNEDSFMSRRSSDDYRQGDFYEYDDLSNHHEYF